MLDPETLKRRIDAARTLRGLTQQDLGALLHDDGLGKHDVGRIERGKMDLQAIHRHALCRHLGVPEAWFLEPDLDRLMGGIGRDEIRERLEALEDQLQDALKQSTDDELRQPPGALGRDAQGFPPTARHHEQSETDPEQDDRLDSGEA